MAVRTTIDNRRNPLYYFYLQACLPLFEIINKECV